VFPYAFLLCAITRSSRRASARFGIRVVYATSLPLDEQFQSLSRENHLSVSSICCTFLRVSGYTSRVTAPRSETVVHNRLSLLGIESLVISYQPSFLCFLSLFISSQEPLNSIPLTSEICTIFPFIARTISSSKTDFNPPLRSGLCTEYNTRSIYRPVFSYDGRGRNVEHAEAVELADVASWLPPLSTECLFESLPTS